MMKDKEKFKIYQKKWESENRLARNAYMAKYHQNIRKALLDLLGGKCVKCGFDNFRALQVDHIKGGGNREYIPLKNKTNYNKFLIKKILAGSKDYQLLCANCNWIKRHENKEYFK